MNRLSLLLVLLLAACASSTPHYDKRFGEALRDARRAMTIDPDAGSRPDPVVGIDGRAAAESQKQYQKSFKEPPRAVNVINIGGAIGGQSGDGSGNQGQR